MQNPANPDQTLDDLIAKYTDEYYTAEEHDADARGVLISSPLGTSYYVHLDHYGDTVVMGQYYWGRGDDLAEAKANFKSQGGSLIRGYTIYEFPPETLFMGVNGMGVISWDGPEPKRTEVKARKGAA